MLLHCRSQRDRELPDSVPVGQPRMRVCLLKLVTCSWNGPHHNHWWEQNHSFRTTSLETIMLVVQPSYMMTLLLLQIEIYPTFEKCSAAEEGTALCGGDNVDQSCGLIDDN